MNKENPAKRKSYGEAYRTTLVCVDGYQDQILSGQLSNPYFPESRQFRSLIGFICEMESMMDEMDFPQRFMAERSFCSGKKTVNNRPLPTENTKRGKLATFSVRVLFRRNASWQGTVTWMEEEKTEHFRSALELIQLMDSALGNWV